MITRFAVENFTVEELEEILVSLENANDADAPEINFLLQEEVRDEIQKRKSKNS